MIKKTILLVEGNEEVRRFNRFLLEGQGYGVETAMTLAEARSLLERQKPDIILLEIGMPDGSGLDFLRELRRYSSVPVLILTRLNEEIARSNRNKSKSSIILMDGAATCLTKSTKK